MRDLFLRAAAIPRAERHAFLERACPGDKGLIAEVEDLLKYHPEESAPEGKRDVRLHPGGALRVEAEAEAAHAASVAESGTRPAGPAIPGPVVASSVIPAARAPLAGPPTPADPHEGSRLPMPSRTPDGAGAPPVTEAKYGAVPSSIEQGPFTPGHLLAGRYRVVERIGKGGMGIVYRAEDMVLNQQVALKFLPDAFADHPSRKARFLNEARVALQITHPNVCRVHDIGEIDGRQFISMEYVGGEDLGSLLKRVGRPHVERAIGLARQMCAGLQAAHDKGVLHRDLKPANVMVDDDGDAKILDFGLAGMAAGISGMEVKAGTPTYMAPEQLRGDGVTVQSDVYGLGLLMYELFTGKKAWEAESIPELMHLHRSTIPRDPRELVSGLDERIVRAIMSCLARDPKDRPKSARAVAVMLPGGDPLAAAIAAGETPSPEVVAQSGGRGVMKPAHAILCVLGVVALLVGVSILAPRVSMQDIAYLRKSPAVLANEAEEMFARLGYRLDGQSKAYAMDYYEELVKEIEKQDKGVDRWERLAKPRPAAIDFWYRASPGPLRPMNKLGKVTMTDPAPTEPGMISLRLSPAGQLRELYVRYRDASDPTTPDGWRPPQGDVELERTWRLLFELAELPYDAFTPATPVRVPPVFGDVRAAWDGFYPESPEIKVRVEAAAYRGQAVAFRLIEEQWPKASQTGVPEELSRRGIPLWVTTSMLTGLVIGSLVLAPMNVAARRVDLYGGMKVGVGCAALWLAGWEMRASHVWTIPGELDLLGRGASQSLLVGAALVLFYIAIEPNVRRLWPQMLISWERLLGGRLRDPLVGKHGLIGALLGVASAGAFYLNMLVPALLGRAPPPPFMDSQYGMDAMSGARTALGSTLHMSVASVREGLALVLALVLIKLIVKKPWVAGAIFAAALTLFGAMLTDARTIYTYPVLGVIAVAMSIVIVRYGLLSAAVCALVYHVLVSFPLTPDPTAWFFDASIFSYAFVTGAAVFCALVASGIVRGQGPSVTPGTSATRLL